MKTAGRNWKPPMSDSAREKALQQLGVAPAARWAWSDADIRKALKKSPARRLLDERCRARARWDDLIETTQQLHGVDLVTACLAWLDPTDLAQLACVGIGGFGERISSQEVA